MTLRLGLLTVPVLPQALMIRSHIANALLVPEALHVAGLLVAHRDVCLGDGDGAWLPAVSWRQLRTAAWFSLDALDDGACPGNGLAA